MIEIANSIELHSDGIHINGVLIPYHLATDIGVNRVASDPDLFVVTVGFYANQVHVSEVVNHQYHVNVAYTDEAGERLRERQNEDELDD